MPRKILLIVNRRARRGADKIKEAIELLNDLNVAVVEENARTGGDLFDQVRRRLGIVDAVVVAGGDGTINSALGALVHGETPLGILPLGTANNLARTLDIPLDLRSACELIATGQPRAIDVGTVNDRYFLTTASLGMSVRITRQLSGETKHRWGRFAYVIAAGRVFRNSYPFAAELRLPGKTIETQTVQIVVGNGLYYGTKLRVADDAEIDDHSLDVLSVEVSRWWELLRLFPSLKKGDHAKREDVLSLRTRELEIITDYPRRIDVDGELITSTPATFRVLPNALKVLAPEAST
jgi:diacylglycerol kinase (ATP)